MNNPVETEVHARPEAEPSVAAQRRARWPELRTAGALAVILLLGAALRLYNVNWDVDQHLHPDERFVTMVETAIQLPSGLAQYFDTRTSPLNPYNRGYNSFVYGTYPLFLVRALAEPLGMQTYDKIHLLGRMISAVHDLGTIVLVFLIGTHLYGRRVGLLAALLLAFTALDIQQSHFFTVDTYLTFYLAAAFYCTLRALESRRPAWYVLAGVAVGLATASKINALLFGIVPLAAIGADWLRHRGQARSRQTGWSPLVGGVAMGLVTLAVFRLGQPYAFAGPSVIDVLPNPAWLNDLTAWQRIASGEADYPPGHQWAFTEPYLFPLRNIVLWGMGLPLGAAAWIGVAVAALQLARGWRRHEHHLLILVWILVNFWYWGQQFVKTVRYYLPMYPFLVLLAAYFGFWILDFGLRRLRAASSVQPEGIHDTGSAPANPKSEIRNPKSVLAYLVLAIITGGAILYGLAFTSIYSRPVTRVAASDWIYEHIPPGTAIGFEHWDDPIPLRRPGHDPGIYKGVQFTLYDDDYYPQKRDKLEKDLNQAEYIFLTSNRLYGSIARLPMRYPLSTRYYQWLFNGDLGFRLERTFTSYPSLFGLSLSDDTAEEAFTVYDHPKVLIFRKTEDYSPERVHELLFSVDINQVVRIRPIQASQGALLLSDADRATQQTGGTWTELFDRTGLANRLPVLVWLLALEALALAVYPLVWSLLSGLADRGFLLAKLLGLLAVSYLAWLAASLHVASYSRATIVAVVVLLAALSVLVARLRWTQLGAFLRANWRLLALEQGLFLLAFGGFLLVRMANPDLWHPNFGGEKPMDFAYLNAVIRSSSFPAYDPWFAGGYINYYYFGFVLTATLVKLTGIVPWVAYNLAIPLYFALTVGAAFSFGYSFLAGQGRTARWPGRVAIGCGLLAAVLVAVVGNLDALVQVSDGLSKLSGGTFQSRIPGLAGAVNALLGLREVLNGKSLPPLDFWRSTRVIGPEDPGPISEFPWFTFLYGDLHAHMIALPITIAAILVGLNVLRQAEARTLVPRWRAREGALVLAWRLARSPWPWSLALAAWLAGTLRATNTWDYPTYLVLAMAAFGLAHYRLWRTIDLRTVGWTVAAAGGLGLLSIVFYQPYLSHYALFYTGVEPIKQSTALVQYLTIFGVSLLLVGSALVAESWLVWRSAARALVLQPATAAQPYHAGSPVPLWLEQVPLGAMPAIALVLLGAAFSILGKPTAAFAAAGLALVAFHALRPGRPVELRYLLVLVGLSLSLTIVPEFVALKGDIGRMNTVFKFYLQAWVMLALVGAVAVFYVDRRLRQLAGASSSLVQAWQWVVVAIVAAALLYPALATGVKLKLRFQESPPTVDGMAYMERAVYQDAGRAIPLVHDAQAITWLLDNVQGSPVIVEAVGPLYHWSSRVSIYTGLPTVLGWDWHQKQQRGDFGYMIDERAQQVKQFFDTPSPDAARQFLTRYGVSYVYVGPLERAYYAPQGLAKFDQMVGSTLEVVYRTPEVTIYRVVGP
ncbi:MAG: glycosyltransferase family 39 protein [Chloroflexi bacterium]|nr:glycosyltransferase family 39 protein [Chloroflexota bacterium]